jgi:hypothetical protein
LRRLPLRGVASQTWRRRTFQIARLLMKFPSLRTGVHPRQSGGQSQVALVQWVQNLIAFAAPAGSNPRIDPAAAGIGGRGGCSAARARTPLKPAATLCGTCAWFERAHDASQRGVASPAHAGAAHDSLHDPATPRGQQA